MLSIAKFLHFVNIFRFPMCCKPSIMISGAPVYRLKAIQPSVFSGKKAKGNNSALISYWRPLLTAPLFLAKFVGFVCKWVFEHPFPGFLLVIVKESWKTGTNQLVRYTDAKFSAAAILRFWYHGISSSFGVARTTHVEVNPQRSEKSSIKRQWLSVIRYRSMLIPSFYKSIIAEIYVWESFLWNY